MIIATFLFTWKKKEYSAIKPVNLIVHTDMRTLQALKTQDLHQRALTCSVVTGAFIARHTSELSYMDGI